MAEVRTIVFHAEGQENKEMNVGVRFQPDGALFLGVPIPPAFYDCILNMAQKAADFHEEKMRAEILAEKEGESDDASNKL
jgi:hypothetical protein